MTLLVAGGAGFIGSCFVAQAVARGHQVIVLDKLTYAGHPANLEWIEPRNWRLVQGDIADSECVGKLLRGHHVLQVVNFAAESHVDNSISGSRPFLDSNVAGTFGLLEACREYWNGLPALEKADFRLLHLSTDEVYGSIESGAFSETSPVQPNSPYSASKAAGDHLARAWHRTYGLPVVTTRCGNNYGPRQHPEKLIPRMIACALAGETLPLYGDGRNVRDWIHVEDHCDGLWLALEKGAPGGVYHFSGRAPMENIALAERICAILDAKRAKPKGSYRDQIGFVADRPGHDRRYATDDATTRAELGFAPRRALDAGLEETVDWYLSHHNWRGQGA